MMDLSLGLWGRSGGAAIPLPALDLNFLTGSLDGRITFTRGSVGTRVNSSGLVETITANNPRFDYSPVTLASKGLLIEEARTNTVLRSDDFATTWTTVNASVSANAIASPDGTTNADKVIVTNAVTQGRVNQSVTLSATTTYTWTLYAKAAEWNYVIFRPAEDGAPACFFNVGAGTVGTVGAGWSNATITAAGNGWYRCSATITTVGTSYTIRFLLSNADNTYSTGNGTSGLYLWGAQVEAGAFSTSYIPTAGSAVARSADVAVMTGTNFSGWYNATEGTFLVRADSEYYPQGTIALLTASDNTNANIIYLDGDLGVSRPSLTVFTGNVLQANLTDSGFTAVANTPYNFAAAYKANDFGCSVNGRTTQTDTSGTVPTVNRLGVGNRNGSARFLNGHLQSLKYYSTRLSDANLRTVTA